MKKAYTFVKKHISWKMCIFFLVWLAIVIPSYLWLVNNPDCTSFVLSNIDEINNTTIYWVENATIPEYVEPPCAYHIWNFFNKAKIYLLTFSAALIILSLITNLSKVTNIIKKMREIDLDDEDSTIRKSK